MNDILDLPAVYPTPPSVSRVRARLLVAPATADVLAEDFDCLVDQILVILTGFECFAAVPGQWGDEWIVLERPAPTWLWPAIGGALFTASALIVVLLIALVFWGLRSVGVRP